MPAYVGFCRRTDFNQLLCRTHGELSASLCLRASNRWSNRWAPSQVTDFGATLTSLMLPDKNGALADCVLGFDSVDGYAAAGTPYFGTIVGR